jgi:Ca2+-binding RTX toxin-like protein
MIVFYHVALTPEQEVADVTSTASGSGWVIFDTETVAATYLFDIDGFDFTWILSGTPPTPPPPAGSVTRTHFHAQARDLNGGIVFGQLDPYDDNDDLAVVLNADGSWSISGSWETTDAKPITGTFPGALAPLGTFADVLGSAAPGSEVPLYFNVHTAEHGSGEIRGQLAAVANDIDDLEMGTAGNDVIAGGHGNDAILGLAGDDTLLGGNDNDVLDGGADNDRLTGGNGNDHLYGSTGNDTLEGGNGNDTMEGGSDNDVVNGGTGNDKMEGNNGDDALNGGTGNDTMDGGHGNDSLIGGHGNDSMAGGTGNDSLNGGTGNDTMDGGADNDILTGGHGNDTLNGGTGDDVLTGGYGADLFVCNVDFGDDVITDFGNTDGIQFDDELFASPEAVLLAAQQVGDDTVITAGANSVTLLGVEVSSLQANDFSIVA